MIRVVLVHAALFLAPFAVYAIWLAIARRADVSAQASWPADRLTWLGIVGLALTILGFLGLGTFSGAPPGSTYVPPRFEDGRIVPGHHE
jgi:multidrug transporter EmrE-like cation transporter